MQPLRHLNGTSSSDEARYIQFNGHPIAQSMHNATYARSIVRGRQLGRLDAIVLEERSKLAQRLRMFNSSDDLRQNANREAYRDADI